MSRSFAADAAASESRMIRNQWGQGADAHKAVEASNGELTLVHLSGTSMGFRMFAIYEIVEGGIKCIESHSIRYCLGEGYAPNEKEVRDLIKTLEAKWGWKMTGNDGRGFSCWYPVTATELTLIKTLEVFPKAD